MIESTAAPEAEPALDEPTGDETSGPTWERWVGAAAVVAATAFVFFQLHPELLFKNTTTNGGDTGAHVWWPAYMRDHVFPNFRLSGWAPDWYAGFPVGHFYFPVPALLIVALDVVLPYNIAFKLVTALGPLLLPVAAYSFARNMKAPWPAPPIFAAVTLPFLFYTGYTIYGGNLPSTLAGEFSFSIALAFTLFFLGSFVRALDDDGRYWVPAALLALVVTTHIIVGFFAVTAAVLFWLTRRPVKMFWRAAAVGGTAFLLSAVWTVPMVGRLAYATDMGWGKITEYRPHLLPSDLRWAVLLAGVALVLGAAYLRRVTLELTALVALFGVLFVVWPEGRLWNARLLPFFYLPLLFLAAMGITEMVNLVRGVLSSRRTAAFVAAGASGSDDAGGEEPPRDPAPEIARRLHRFATAFPAVVAVLAVAFFAVYAHRSRDFIPSWVAWNYHGYEDKAAYPEYREIMDTLGGFTRPGRLLWERLDGSSKQPGGPSLNINDYGSDLALELIPYFTDGRIGSMEGLYFESAATTPFHFLTVAELAQDPSNPVRGLEYGTLAEDFDLGVKHLQALGVRYYMAASKEALAKAGKHPDLRLVTAVPADSAVTRVAQWHVFEVQGTAVVAPLDHEPVVLDDVTPHEWREPAVDWFLDEGQLDRPLAGDGPEEWARVNEADADRAPREKLPEVVVSDVETDEDSVRFRVDRTGVPVLVKTSYFPNWQADGARGPWRVTPNFMVVIPTEEEVELTYGLTPLDRSGQALTVAGLGALAGLVRWRPRRLDDDEDARAMLPT